MYSVGVFGSCVTRDLFNSNFWYDYKKYFKIVTDSQRCTIISFMTNPVQIDFDDLKTDDPLVNRLLKEDFLKNKRLDLVQKHPNYYIFDINFDVIFGVIILADGNIITNNVWDLPKTSFFQNEENYKTLTIFNDSKEYFSLFKDNVDSFFDFLENNCPNMKIILNSFRNSYKYLDENNKLSIDDTFKTLSLRRNIYFKKFEEYIVDNYDVEILYNQEYLIDKKHLWGFAPHHFEQRFYDDKSFQLKKLLMYYETLRYNNEYLKKLNLLQEKNRYLNIKNRELITKIKTFKKNNSHNLFNRLLK